MNIQDETSTSTLETWETPAVITSDVFTKAALACCLDEFGDEIGSTGVSVPCP
ncbi:MAG: hypothetical protein ACI81R_001188 [Bradymonadia bacterium]|jgi:hypothetical protein